MGLAVLFAQARLFTYLPNTNPQLEEVLRYLKTPEYGPT
jgi:hypothetical protein